MANPQITQGVLNRVRTSAIIPAYTNLNITAPFLGKSMIVVEFEGNFAEQIETATGAVRSPEPYVMATATCNLLRSQSLAASWLAQGQTDSFLGTVNLHSDTSAYPVITLNDTVIRMVQNGAFDGQDPIVRVVLRGVFPINSNMWNSF
ncbi:TPA: hypothetical protein QDC06_000228 [Burkholderia cepacia]|nr:hypothetical protein BZY94_06155 [Burkholderia territorii]HDR9497043.1 hypothetical protein [Burkholderia cepacia]